MKVIDLLNKKANEEEMPKQIKYNSELFVKSGNGVSNDIYYCSEDYELSKYINLNSLNDEIEIIEENKPIEKVKEIRELIEASFNKLEEAQDKINRLENELEKRGNK